MATAAIDRKRLAEVKKRGLDSGAHRRVEDGMCAMEAFSCIRRIPFTDHPPCVSPVIAGFMRNLVKRMCALTDEPKQKAA